MAYEVVVPRLGLTMEEGRIIEWYKQDGEYVEAGEPLFSVETDKAVQDVEAPVSGIVYRVPDLPSDPLPIGTVIGYILEPGEEVALPQLDQAATCTAIPGEAAASTLAAVVTQKATADGRKPSTPGTRRRMKKPDIGREQAVQIKVSPVARRLAEAAGIDLAQLAAQKLGGKILHKDVEAAIAARKAPTTPPPSTLVVGEDMPTSQIRRVIAERMAESAHATAPVTLMTEADATELVRLREQLKETLAPRGVVVPTYNDLIIKLTGVALQEHPMLNAYLKDDQIIIPTSTHIAVAVDTEAGLLVPVIRDVPIKTIQQIAEESRSLAEKARAGQLGPDDLQGGTFTVTNLGMYGVEGFTPIINLPQCAILGLGRVISKPAVYNGEIVPRQMLALSLTFDHRVVDGAPAARFLNTIEEYVEQPYLWLIR